MAHQQQILTLYRLFYTLTRHCPDRSLKLYIRRRAKEDFHALKSRPLDQATTEVERLKGELEVVRRQMNIRSLYLS